MGKQIYNCQKKCGYGAGCDGLTPDDRDAAQNRTLTPNDRDAAQGSAREVRGRGSVPAAGHQPSAKKGPSRAIKAPPLRYNSMTDKRPHFIPGLGWRYDNERGALHNHPTHNYNAAGIYEITLVVAGRRPLLGTLRGSTLGSGPSPYLDPSPLGHHLRTVELPKMIRIHPMMKLWAVCLMPDHLHMILQVNSPLPGGKHLGQVIGALKGAMSRAWWALPENAGKPHTPFFEEGYFDRILMREGQLQHWYGYLDDNPYRKVFMKEHPDIMQRVQCITLGGVRYGAFGNLFLLLHPERLQVFFHRKTLVNGREVPTEETDFWMQEQQRLTEAAMQGDVLVTPGISRCELMIKHMAMERAYRMIHLQKEPIGRYFKPELSRFEACRRGTLLVLAPWKEAMQGFESDYGRFHHLNDLAASICRLSLAEAKAALANAQVF